MVKNIWDIIRVKRQYGEETYRVKYLGECKKYESR
jgi:hypothetical protein